MNPEFDLYLNSSVAVVDTEESASQHTQLYKASVDKETTDNMELGMFLAIIDSESFQAELSKSGNLDDPTSSASEQVMSISNEAVRVDNSIDSCENAVRCNRSIFPGNSFIQFCSILYYFNVHAASIARLRRE